MSIKNFQKRFSRGKKVAGNYIKCGWNSTLTETKSCHVSKTKRIDWLRDTACHKGGGTVRKVNIEAAL